MTALEMGSAGKKSVLRFFLGKYFSIWGGDFASPHFLHPGTAHG